MALGRRRHPEGHIASPGKSGLESPRITPRTRRRQAMSEALHFWQGGQKVDVREDASGMTIHAPNEAAARVAADRAGIQLESVERAAPGLVRAQSEEHTSELQSQSNLVCRLLLEKKKKKKIRNTQHKHK